MNTEPKKSKGKESCPECIAQPKIPWHKKKLFQVLIIAVILLVLSFIFYKPFFNAFIDYLNLIWWAILLGFLLGGVIDYLVPSTYIQRYLAKKEKKTILYSVVFGFLMSACSHGILAIAIELYRKGASIPAVIAFLLASPWANLPITILLLGFFGVKALYIIISAIIIAIITGLIYQFFERRNWIEKSKPLIEMKKEFSIKKDIKNRFNKYEFNPKNLSTSFKGIAKGSWALTEMVLWWILIGMILASAARAFVPTELFHQFLGPSILGLFITLIIATIIEVCSEGSSPIAFEIFNQTRAFGNSFVFLMAGVATDYTEIGLIWSNIGKRTAIMLPLITVPQILVLGFLFNLLL
ncbi:MAG: permease [archaeon]|nr:permease [Candidatus Micrarchaeota archaeon]